MSASERRPGIWSSLPGSWRRRFWFAAVGSAAAEAASLALAWMLVYEDVPPGAGYFTMRVIFALTVGGAGVGAGLPLWLAAGAAGGSAAAARLAGVHHFAGVSASGGWATGCAAKLGWEDAPPTAALLAVMSAAGAASWLFLECDRAVERRFGFGIFKMLEER